MSSRRNISVLFAALLMFSMGASVIALRRIDRIRSGSAVQELLFVPSPKFVKAMSLGYTGLMADIYWTRAVQYFGRHHHEGKLEYKYLAPLLEITAALDPHLIPTYEFGSVFLAQKPPEGAGQPDRAVSLVEFGLKNNPNEWKLYYNLGFIHSMERKDTAKAAEAFLRGSRIPGSHPWMKGMAAAMAHDSGDPETARMLWQALYVTAEQPLVKKTAMQRLVALRADEEIEVLEALVLKYKKLSGANAVTWRELIRAGVLKGVPHDPIGNPYLLTPEGKVLVKDVKALPFTTQGLGPEAGASDSSHAESNRKKAS